jgi:hypothetical protein
LYAARLNLDSPAIKLTTIDEANIGATPRQAVHRLASAQLINRSKEIIMKANQFLAASLLGISALGVMAQEIDPSENLQARTLAAAKAAQSERTRAAVVAETRNAQAAGELKVVGDRAEAPVSANERTAVAQRQKTRAEVRAELTAWNATHKQVVGEFNGEPTDQPAPDQVAQAPLTREQVKAELAQWRLTHPLVVGDRY